MACRADHPRTTGTAGPVERKRGIAGMVLRRWRKLEGRRLEGTRWAGAPVKRGMTGKKGGRWRGVGMKVGQPGEWGGQVARGGR